MKKSFGKKNNVGKNFHKKLFDSKNINNTQNNVNEFIFDSNDNNNNEKVPIWMNPETKEIKDNKRRFNKEIIDFVYYIIPNDEILTKCQETIDLLIKIIKKNKPNWQVIVFGSYSQNIPTIFSDIDILIICDYNKDFQLKEMYNLMNILKDEKFSDKIKLVKAKIPIIKTTCSITGINLDISMNKENGFHAIEVVKKILKKYKILKPSLILFKILLKKFSLNESSTGGMGSFLLFHLLYFFFIHKFKIKNSEEKNEYSPDFKVLPENIINNNILDRKAIINFDLNYDIKSDESNKENENNIKIENLTINEENKLKDECNSIKIENKINDYNNNYKNLGNNNKNFKDDDNINNNDTRKEKDIYDNYMDIGGFILSFLQFFGCEFDYINKGFSLNDNYFGNIFNKEERNDIQHNKNLCVESIIEKGRDIGFPCYNYETIKNLFKAVYNKINSEFEKNNCSILQSLGFPTNKEN